MDHQTTSTAAAFAVVPGRSERLVARLHEDWLLARAAGVNLLLLGTDGSSIPDLLRPNIDEPIASWSPGERLVLPPAVRTRTMVLREVGMLGHADQLRLLEWLDAAAGRIQVVSTTSSPLLARVETGAFLDSLYYRLNTVCVDLTRG